MWKNSLHCRHTELTFLLISHCCNAPALLTHRRTLLPGLMLHDHGSIPATTPRSYFVSSVYLRCSYLCHTLPWRLLTAHGTQNDLS